MKKLILPFVALLLLAALLLASCGDSATPEPELVTYTVGYYLGPG